ncbi:hypothetical protein P7B02_15310 [Caulobacter segnis]|uniref:hypothetical protein n=1 Tax=Caulobacter segnis TaxID=88688 RepID=UPI0024101AF1|nr:hypothetical protein [Caulobacter segnis]MDG2522902.1 hypothetical protein [Caulobacter segnis]
MTPERSFSDLLRTSRAAAATTGCTNPEGLHLDLMAAPGTDLMELNTVFAAASLLEVSEGGDPSSTPAMVVSLRVPNDGAAMHHLRITEANGAWAQFSDANRRVLAELLLSRLQAPIQLWPQQVAPPAHTTAGLANELRALATAPPTVGFVDLVRRTSLDPSRDFRAADLTGVDFRGQDITAFDLQGAITEGALFDDQQTPIRSQARPDQPFEWASLSPIAPQAVERISRQLGGSFRRNRFLEAQLMHGAVSWNDADHHRSRAAIRETVLRQRGLAAFVRIESPLELRMAQILAEELKSNSEAAGMLFVQAPPSRSMKEPTKRALEEFSLQHIDIAWISFDGAPETPSLGVHPIPPPHRSRRALDDYAPTLLGRIASAGPPSEVRAFQNPLLAVDQRRRLPLHLFGAASSPQDPVLDLIRTAPHLAFDEGRGQTFLIIAEDNVWGQHGERLASRLPFANVYGRKLAAGEKGVFIIGAATDAPVWGLLLETAADLDAPTRHGVVIHRARRAGDPVGPLSSR